MSEAELSDRVRERWRAVARRLPPGINRIAERIAGRELLLEASSLGFYGLVSALPLLTITFSLVGLVAGDAQLEQFAQQAEESGPAGTGQILQQLLENSDSLSWAAVLFTIWPATAYGGGLRRALSRATEEDATAPALRGRATAVGMVFALPVLVLAGLPLVAVLTSLGDDGLAGTILGWGLALVVGVTALTLILTLLYNVFTPDRLGWRDTLRGAAITAAVTTLFSIGFVAYLRLGSVEDRFGGATIGLIVMLGVYLFVANALLLAGFEAAAGLDGGDLDESGDRDDGQAAATTVRRRTRSRDR
ncbi:MAG: YihY/virulence factor BrkB family protein [Nitriliruptor sp.]|uniref:YihY/virulence factor BrkB family protein n=1 Tax=Nitriliruptor sp. TaxID=2448056 RepID=UPI0034A0520E